MSTPTPVLPLFYRNVVALSRDRHRGWYFDPDQGFSFAAGTNSVYIAAAEFAAAARELPLVFTRDAAGNAVPGALLGLAAEQNLMVDAQGGWRGTYVPAYIRRYPFILATSDAQSQQFTLCIDEAYSGFNTAKEGELLVNDSGEQGPLLEKSVKFLQEFHQHSLTTTKFCQALDQAQLLDSMQANISLNSGAKFSLSGFFCVTRERLQKLEAATVKQLLDSGALELIYLHMHSLANLDRLMGLAQEPAKPAPRARRPAKSSEA